MFKLKFRADNYKLFYEEKNMDFIQYDNIIIIFSSYNKKMNNLKK